MAIKIQKRRKGPMYECIVFLEGNTPKKWKYVTNLKSFTEFLSKQHSRWLYVNVYEKGTNQFLKRFYKGGVVPKIFALLAVAFGCYFLQSNTIRNQTFALPSTFSGQGVLPMKNTFVLLLTFKALSSIDFNYSATIPTPSGGVQPC